MIGNLLFRAFHKVETNVHELNYLFWECTTRCNLHCRHCGSDCKEASGESDMPIADFIAALKTIPRKAIPKNFTVVLTGGEPTLVENMPELVAALKERGFWIAVETNGTNDADWLAFVDYVSCSPKAEFPESVAISRADEVRVVASSEGIVPFCCCVRERIPATDYYISPCDRGGEIDFATAKAVLSQLDGWSLSVQLHKLLGFR